MFKIGMGQAVWFDHDDCEMQFWFGLLIGARRSRCEEVGETGTGL